MPTLGQPYIAVGRAYPYQIEHWAVVPSSHDTFHDKVRCHILPVEELSRLTWENLERGKQWELTADVFWSFVAENKPIPVPSIGV